MPAASVTITFKVLLLASVWPLRVQVFWPTEVVAVVQLLPLSKDTDTISPLPKLALKVPLMVCAAVLVMKSLVLLPVSALNTAVATVVAAPVVSIVQLLLLLLVMEILPATSVCRTCTAPVA